MLCIVYKLEEGLAWRSAVGGVTGGRVSERRGRRNQILPHLFTIKENQGWNKKNPQKKPRGRWGRDLQEPLDDNAASCVYTVREHTFKKLYYPTFQEIKKPNFETTKALPGPVSLRTAQSNQPPTK